MGRGRAVTVAVRATALDEAQMEIAARKYEAREHLARLAPLHVRLYSFACAVSPAAEQLVAAAMYECQRYGKKNA